MCMIELLRLIPPGACVPMDDLCEALPDRTRSNIGSSLSRLILRDLLIRREVGCFALTPDGEAFVASGQLNFPRIRANPPRNPQKTCLIDKVWTALRIKRKASVAELEELSAVKTGTISAYVRFLIKAGYVIRNNRKKIVLIKDTGPLAPRHRGRKTAPAVLDRNTEEQVSL